MTIHLTLTWLWWLLGIVWFTGMLLYQWGLTVVSMDDKASWLWRFAGFVWPITIPLIAVFAFLCAIFGLDGDWK